MPHLGSHFLAEFFDCDRDRINDAAFLETVMIEAARRSRATVIQPFFHRFSPHGVSGILVIAESHFAVHTWPEHGYVALDLFSCGEFDYRAALAHVRDSVGAGRCLVARVRRGDLEGRGAPTAEPETLA